MTLRFSLPYRTVFGQRLAVCGSHPDLGNWQPTAAADMNYDEASACWSIELTVADTTGELTYKYVLRDANTGGEHWEAGPNRTIAYDAARTQRLHLADYWRAPAQPENELLTAAFTKALFRRPTGYDPAQAPAAGTPAVPAKKAKAPAAAKGAKAAKAIVEVPSALTTHNQPTTKTAAGETTFRILAPRVAPQHGLCILGSDPTLGAWNNTKALVLSDADYPTWSGTVKLANPAEDCLYKYAMWDAAAGHALDMEGGENRVIPAT